MLIHKLALLFAGFASALPTTSETCEEAHTGDLPILDLPYGRWRATKYDPSSDVYTFRNIRFAAPPTGALRWAKPAPPEPVSDIQDGSVGHNCIPLPLPEGWDPVFDELVKTGNEDCLFLDMYVPGKALKGIKKDLPVIVYIHGGGYTTGAKDVDTKFGIYDGTNLINKTDGNAIMVVPNYRLGMFGFLGGTTMEQTAVPNVAFHDQYAALQWVQNFIHLVGGDANNVSAWGESAGGGSILYHLVAEGGRRDPLFHRAFVMGPASNLAFHGDGTMEDGFQQALKIVGCEGKDVSCLRAADITALKEANENITALPAPDGTFIRTNPAIEFAKGNFWPHLRSIIVSYTADEGYIFLPEPIDPGFASDYIDGLFSSADPELIQDLVRLYTDKSSNKTTPELARKMFGDSVINCNTRRLVQAYSDRSYMTRFSAFKATHGADLVAAFYSASLYNETVPLYDAYQSYLVSYALTGDPNTYRQTDGDLATIHWPLVDVRAKTLDNTVNVTNNGFEIIQDGLAPKSTCDAWDKILMDVTQTINI